jgi:hypothetical protein
VLLLGVSSSAQVQPVIFRFQTNAGNDTLFVGRPDSRIIFTVEPNESGASALTFPLQFSFTNGNVIGAAPVSRLQLAETYEPAYVCEFSWCELQGTDPDSLLFGLIAFGGGLPLDTPSNEIAWISFTPLDTGRIMIDSIFLPPASHLSAVDPVAQSLPVEWIAPVLTVVPCPAVMGDCNHDGKVTSADIIVSLGAVWKCGRPPEPWWILDVDCNGVAVAADIITLINHIFRGAALPCGCHPLVQPVEGADTTWHGCY